MQVPASTVHAIGAALVLLEVQDPVYVTYRLYDYGRLRPLQVEEALTVANLDAASKPEANPADWFPDGCVLARAPRFIAERHTIGQGLTLQPDGRRYHILVPLAPGVLLNQRELRREVTALMPAIRPPGDARRDGAGVGGRPACGAGPHQVLISVAGSPEVAQDIAASRLRSGTTAKLVAISDIA